MSQILDEKLKKLPKAQQDLWAMRHSAEHILHQAIQSLYPNVKPAMGPATEDGFYFDFDAARTSISEADFPKIEKEMHKIIKANLPLRKEEITASDAKKIFANNPFKLEWIEEIAKRGEKVSVYWTGEDFVDLCSGPHVTSTGKIGPFKLLKIAGAYWRGDEKNKMLTRIYGTCFPTKEELDKYLWQQEEAEKRDHRRVGAQLGLWTFSDLVGSGLPLFTQKGALIRRLILEYVEGLQSKQGIAQVWTPQIAKAELFKISGHYDKYHENMMSVKSNYSDEEFFLKPMNCPQHTQIYASQLRSYRDLPLRFSDFAMLYRDEKPGELLGLARTRSFSQDDCHIFCREDQIEEEMEMALKMTQEVMKTYGFSYKYRLSTRDPNKKDEYLGDPKLWDKAEALSEKLLKDNNIDYFPGPGEAAFYAPKLDLIATDSIGREWQLSTLQIDYVQPARFKLKYIDEKGEERTPVMLHRAISGSPERLMAILIEHYAGAFPTWLAPVQVKVLPITDRNLEYATEVLMKLRTEGLRAELDDRNETLQAKIRDAQLEKVPYMVIIGGKEEEAKKVSVRVRGEKGDLGQMDLNDFLRRAKEKIEQKSLSL